MTPGSGADPFGPPPTGPPIIDPGSGQPVPPTPQGSGAPIGLPPPTGSPWGSRGPGSAVPGPIAPNGAPGTPFAEGGRARPWWGLGDALLSLPFIVMATVVCTVVWAVGAALTGSLDIERLTNGGDDLPASLFAASLVGQQLGQGIWPWIVSKWKGRGMALDWGWSFAWRDLWIGPLTALAALILAVAMGSLIGELVGISDEVSNTDFLTDAEGTLSYWVLIFGVAIGAPVSEELLFRGLILRAFEKRAGPIVAVIGSTVAFTLPHYISATPAELAVLLGTIGSVGLVLGTVAVQTRRLAPVIIAHVLFNSLTVVQILAG